MPRDASRSADDRGLRQKAEQCLSGKQSNERSGDPAALIHELEVHEIELEMQNDELQKSHLEVEASREKYFELYDLAPVGYLSLDEEGLILELNLTAAGLLGIERGYLVNEPFSRFIRPEFQDPFYLHRRKVLESSARQTCELALEKHDGTVFYAQLDSIRVEADGLGIMRTALTDITERTRMEQALQKAHDELETRVLQRTADLKDALDRLKSEAARRERMEERIRQSEKMEAIGTLAGGIAHDFNNMLAAVLGFAELAIDDNIPRNSNVDRDLKHILKAGFRGKDLVKQILAFSRKTHHEVIPLQLTPLIKETLKLLRSTLPSNVKIALKIKSGSDTVRADPSQVQQVVMNLCTNAGFSMRDKQGGKLTISLSDAGESYSTLPAGLEPGRYLCLTVKDTGTGIEPQVIKRIFEPFFTTKERGQGTGLGLAVTYGIVKSLNGGITVESTPGKGTTFKVFLPHAEPSVREEEVAADDIPRGTEVILFVDDENSLVEWGRETLRGLGYRVVGTTDSRDALALFHVNPAGFDMVITDYTMPAMTGFALAEELLKVRPDIPIILFTGYNENASPEKAKERGIKEFVMKPLGKRDLAEAIRRVLDGTKGEKE
ncbi:MAG TPA: ATP-binding protein [Syntrophorhabdaceae bacterium]|jgi:PAS domain S-box-containing protein